MPALSASPLLVTVLLLVAGAQAPSLKTPANEATTIDQKRFPPAIEHSPELAARLEAALEAMPADYVPRTEHLRSDGSPSFVNRLILEPSPYLLQHAHNPVNWYPWGPEAFAAAREQGKPIFLSIGYSTCHWCHVMEKESFEDEAIGRLLNENFIAIKVDRERRPDIDEIYMTALQVTGKRGGWPMSSFLTADAKPFFGGTYFPPENFTRLLGEVDRVWRENRAAILDDAEKIALAVQSVTMAQDAAEELSDNAIAAAVDQLLERHDPAFGGFGDAPKFPSEPDLLLLLQVARRDRDPKVIAALETTLDAMAHGGIYDQIGGGFHRYSTDKEWLVPHFEKMLYNQAHLARVYLQGFLLTGRSEYRRVARETLDYVLREMTAPTGGFYSATDADSPDPERGGESHEGIYFLWTRQELAGLLSPGELELVTDVYGVSDSGNFEGKTILSLPSSLAAVAERRDVSLAALLAELEPVRQKMLTRRAEKAPPIRDDKILTSWNAMMITALCEGFDALGEARYRHAATRAGDLLWQTNRRDDDTLWRLSLDGKASIDAVQEDYAYLIEALVALADATGEARWLERAGQLASTMERLFWDADGGAFYSSLAASDTPRFARPKSRNDGAIPAGNSVAARALARLYRRTGEITYRRLVSDTLAAQASMVKRAPSAYTYLLLAADDFSNGEIGTRQFAADGRVRAEARLTREPSSRELRVQVELEIADGWHINSDQPKQEDLLPTRLSVRSEGASLLNVIYPEPVEIESPLQVSETKRDDEQANTVSAWVGRVTIRARLSEAKEDMRFAPTTLTLALQACDDSVCLQPEDLRLDLGPWD